MDTPTILIPKRIMDAYGRQFEAGTHSAKLVAFAGVPDMAAKLPDADGIALVGELTRKLNGRRIGDVVVEDCPRLKWVHTSSAGVDAYMPKELATRGIVPGITLR